ncbi:MAG: hypothetical protein IKV16_00850 [Clostridia bacterium]|nr:hypothetical protein [Clostridia bacterium]
MRTAMRLIIIALTVIIIGVPCVSATWRYSSFGPTQKDTVISLGMTEFKEEFRGVYIKAVSVVNTTNAANIKNDFTLPTTHNSTSNATQTGGSVTYKITVHNNTDVTYWYIGEYYDNTAQNSLINANRGITITTKDHLSDTSETFNKEDWVPPQTERDFYVTYSYGLNAQSLAQTSVEFRFHIKMDAVHDEFLAVLNNIKSENSYEYLASVMNQQYSKTGSLSITTESHPEVFATLFDDLMVNIDGTDKKASVVIRRENLDKDGTSGDNYSGGGPSGCEYTLYITVEPLTPGTNPTVYAIAYSKGASGMGPDWYQVGELYEGKAPVKSDGTIDYTKWKATSKTYEMADGIYYKVAAPNGDQYDIMTTMEQLISAVDQDIFNDIDNTNIFKKVYDIIKKHPQNSTDPAVVGLRQAFEEASIFYRNLNNGQEFKVVRDKYTRAEIIFAIKNIQKALDYYYQAGNT